MRSHDEVKEFERSEQGNFISARAPNTLEIILLGSISAAIVAATAGCVYSVYQLGKIFYEYVK